MKKFASIALILLVVLPGSALAQNIDKKGYEYYPNEIDLGYGRISLPGFAMGFGAVMGIVLTGGLAAPDKLVCSGAMSVEGYHYYGRFAVGGIGVAENCQIRWKTYSGKDNDGNSVYKPGTTANNWFVTAMPAVKYRWLYRPHFGMYTKGAVGAMACCTPTYERVTQTTDSEGKTTETIDRVPAELGLSFACQLSLLGMEFGGERFRGYTEFGWGMQGLILAGVKYGF